ncbi:unnamed protein product [Ambrosiozyma monospora]|uniref:Unnamed protein product n=1 Tax=Ambrosiozyma monospora TaxID=43982 RepID=A0ACB5SY66_AMBMO|nr:unnamed protein product [Ambrosiozyma monospora]
MSLLLNNNSLKTKLDDDILTDLLQGYKTDSDTNTETLYHLANLYFKTQLRKLDKVSMKELWDSPELISIIKEILSIFFQPLIQLFQKANIYKYVPILKNYFEDLLKFFQSCHGSFEGWNMMVVKLVDIQWKYVPYCYKFMHELYVLDKTEGGESGDSGLFEGLVEWFNRFIEFMNFMKTGDGSKLKIDLQEMLLEAQKNGSINIQKVLDEVNETLDKIEKKKKLYNDMVQNSAEFGDGTSSVSGGDLDNDYLKSIRNDKLNENWDKINDKVFNLAKAHVGGTTTTTTSSSNGGTGTAELMGVSESELLEMNIDMVELPNTRVSELESMTAEQFLNKVKVDEVHGVVETDSEFSKSDEFGYLDKSETSKLSDAFRNALIAVLKAYSDTKQ